MPLRSRFSFLVLVVATLVFAGSLSAQDWKGRGRARGSVKDMDGKPIAGATITLMFKGEKGAGPTLKTDKKGQWSYIGLITGNFSVEVDAEGYAGASGNINVNEYDAAAHGPFDVKLRQADTGLSNKSGEGDRLMQVLSSGNAKLQAKDFAGARAAFQEVLAAVKDAKQQYSLKVAIAGTWLDEGKGPEARAAFEELLPMAEDVPTQTGYLQRIARAYYIENNIDASVATLEKALALHPEGDLTTLRLIIDILVASGREQQAEPYMAKLPAGEKVDANALLNLGITAYNAGDMETAFVKFEAVLKDYPENPDAWYNLGRAQLGRGKIADAKAALEKFLQLAPNHAQAEDAKQFLSYLK